jgi:hypothetical protein
LIIPWAVVKGGLLVAGSLVHLGVCRQKAREPGRVAELISILLKEELRENKPREN